MPHNQHVNVFKIWGIHRSVLPVNTGQYFEFAASLLSLHLSSCKQVPGSGLGAGFITPPSLHSYTSVFFSQKSLLTFWSLACSLDSQQSSLQKTPPTTARSLPFLLPSHPSSSSSPYVPLWSALHCRGLGRLCAGAVVAMELQISHLSSSTLMDLQTVNRSDRLHRYLHLRSKWLSSHKEPNLPGGDIFFSET